MRKSPVEFSQICFTLFRKTSHILKRYNQLKVEPNECIYIDDSTKNISPAKEIGMKTILFKDFEQFKHELNLIFSNLRAGF